MKSDNVNEETPQANKALLNHLSMSNAEVRYV